MKLNRTAALVAASVLAAPAAFAAGPSAGDLSNLTPDGATIMTAIGAVALVLIGINLGLKGFRIVQSLVGKR
ncbi:hypothetical protein [Roseateles asaccharophilus]|uniref:Phage coat protein n=1 Tax=Roseateles asaccharophilus TaxID=582607 RepID=A0ABU2AE45_9BURK|nr:hypothetical protein [Roseateles asaccharophilus]MDR7334278.1 hypothetical protein [Roseateles asaccharophilus]